MKVYSTNLHHELSSVHPDLLYLLLTFLMNFSIKYCKTLSIHKKTKTKYTLILLIYGNKIKKLKISKVLSKS